MDFFGFGKGTPSKTRSKRKDFYTHKGSKQYQSNGHWVHKSHRPYSKRRSGGHRRRSVKGSRSRTHIGDLDYTTKSGDRVFHQNGHYVRKSNKPYTRSRLSLFN